MAVGLGSGHRAASVSVDGGAGSPDAIRSGGPSILAGLNGDGPDRGAPELVPTEVAHGADLPVAIVHGGSDTGPAPFNSERHVGCTTAQLRRFIKSRAYVPMHEIRRRFLISSEDDEVAGIDVEAGRIFVGLPEREGQMLGELLRAGEIGYELQLDPVTPVVVGVYPMRPVTRG